MNMICTKCLREYPERDFYKLSYDGTRCKRCKYCMCEQSKANTAKRKAKNAEALKLEKKRHARINWSREKTAKEQANG